jgi:hypothetical protein
MLSRGGSLSSIVHKFDRLTAKRDYVRAQKLVTSEKLVKMLPFMDMESTVIMCKRMSEMKLLTPGVWELCLSKVNSNLGLMTYDQLVALAIVGKVNEKTLDAEAITRMYREKLDAPIVEEEAIMLLLVLKLCSKHDPELLAKSKQVFLRILEAKSSSLTAETYPACIKSFDLCAKTFCHFKSDDPAFCDTMEQIFIKLLPFMPGNIIIKQMHKMTTTVGVSPTLLNALSNYLPSLVKPKRAGDSEIIYPSNKPNLLTILQNYKSPNYLWMKQSVSLSILYSTITTVLHQCFHRHADLINWYKLSTELKHFLNDYLARRIDLELKLYNTLGPMDQYNVDFGKIMTIKNLPYLSKESREAIEELAAERCTFENFTELNPAFYTWLTDSVKSGTIVWDESWEKFFLEDYYKKSLPPTIADPDRIYLYTFISIFKCLIITDTIKTSEEFAMKTRKKMEELLDSPDTQTYVIDRLRQKYPLRQGFEDFIEVDSIYSYLETTYTMEGFLLCVRRNYAQRRYDKEVETFCSLIFMAHHKFPSLRKKVFDLVLKNQRLFFHRPEIISILYLTNATLIKHYFPYMRSIMENNLCKYPWTNCSNLLTAANALTYIYNTRFVPLFTNLDHRMIEANYAFGKPTDYPILEMVECLAEFAANPKPTEENLNKLQVYFPPSNGNRINFYLTEKSLEVLKENMKHRFEERLNVMKERQAKDNPLFTKSALRMREFNKLIDSDDSPEIDTLNLSENELFDFVDVDEEPDESEEPSAVRKSKLELTKTLLH